MQLSEPYDHQAVEAKWSKHWLESKTYQPVLSEAKQPYYNLMMFPYPSAEGLHVGNMYAFTGADVHGRFQRMQGFDVFEPIGLDGFGIHSENYAIKIGKHPKEQAKVSEQRFYEQLSKIGNGFTWDNRLETYDPHYYKWTQWLFLEMFKHGLAYRKSARVNWCPSCKTVLADEQVEGGRCERCKNETTFKDLPQWFFRITAYADRLLQDIEGLKWPKKIKIAQTKWIGRKTGLNIHYPIEGMTGEVVCFTTRPDTNFGATFVVLGPEHPLISTIAEQVAAEKRQEIEAYVASALAKTENERIAEGRAKTGVFTGLYVLNRLNNEKLPLYISDFVIGTVGTGAVVGVPGHDKRDFQFATAMGIPIKRVVVGMDGDTSEISREEQVLETSGTMVNSGFLDGLETNEAIQKMMDYQEEKDYGERANNYHLRDWLISRQRYWGAPIPMVYCERCAAKGEGFSENKNWPSEGWWPLEAEVLPVQLPDLSDWQPKGDGRGPLENAPKDWLYTTCPHCGGQAKRETDVCDTFLDSSWYFLAYPNLETMEYREGKETPFNQEITRKWLPVNAYIGGAEHAVLHLLYSRFVWKALCDWKLLPFSVAERPEPFPFLFGHGLIIKDGAKMSKSRGNVVVPDEYIEKYGADALRLYLMFVGPYDQGGDFSDTGMAGMKRFVDRVWRMAVSGHFEGETTSKKLQSKLQTTIAKVTTETAAFRYNTAIAAIMELTNVWREEGRMKREDILTVMKLLAPFAPFLTEEISNQLQHERQSIHQSQWPVVNEAAIEVKPTLIVIQVNGKVRTTIELATEMTQENIEEKAKVEPQVAKWLEGKQIRKTIFVPPQEKRQGLVNFVIS